MEFNARYTLIALFSLSAIGAIFAFVFWLNNSAGFSARTHYQVRFLHPVSGMTEGSDVLFNGLKVGEVTGIYLDKNMPDKITAVIAVEPETPIRVDTTVGIDFQGLAGSANILLTGGAALSPIIKSEGNELPLLVADPSQSRSWTQNASRVLARIDDLIARNTDRFDSILSGLERMAGAGDTQNQKPVHDLAIPDDFQPPRSQPSWQLVIGEPTVVLSLNSDKVLQQITEGSWVQFAEAHWSDNLPNLLQAKIVQSFENAGLSEQILRPADAFEPEFRLVADIRTFHFQDIGSPLVVFDLVAKIIDRDGAVISARRFKLETPVTSSEEQMVIKAFGVSFSSVIRKLVNWTTSSLER